MASLVEELLKVLSKEREEYEVLYGLSCDKRDAIVEKDISLLENISDSEQQVSFRLRELEKSRISIMKDMSVVLGHDNESLTVSEIVGLLEKQPEERAALESARDDLVDAAGRMQFMNEQNKMLLEQAVEMVEFDLNLLKGLRQAPETANYNKNAYNTGDLLPEGGFDFKQ